MRTKLIGIILLLLTAACGEASLLSNLLQKESRLISEPEKKMIIETSSSIGFGYGYDPDLEIDYVYRSREVPEKEISAKSGEMNKTLQKYDTDTLIRLYEKVLQMKETQVWKLDYAGERKNWHDYTFIQKYTLPDMELYFNMIEKYVIQSDQAYASKIEQRKSKIRKSLRDRLKREQEIKDEPSRSKHWLFH